MIQEMIELPNDIKYKGPYTFNNSNYEYMEVILSKTAFNLLIENQFDGKLLSTDEFKILGVDVSHEWIHEDDSFILPFVLYLVRSLPPPI